MRYVWNKLVEKLPNTIDYYRYILLRTLSKKRSILHFIHTLQLDDLIYDANMCWTPLYRDAKFGRPIFASFHFAFAYVYLQLGNASIRLVLSINSSYGQFSTFFTYFSSKVKMKFTQTLHCPLNYAIIMQLNTNHLTFIYNRRLSSHRKTTYSPTKEIERKRSWEKEI